MLTGQDQVPAKGSAREALRQKGQFWTPPWVAEAMVAYALGGGSETLFDPAVGAGAFFVAAKVLAARTGRQSVCLGTELDPHALRQARANGLTDADLRHVEVRDFLQHPPNRRFGAIVANPPYIRHHRLSRAVKTSLRALARRAIGTALDGRAGLHVYFLIQALEILEPDGCLAFVMPADTCEGAFSASLWQWIASKYRLEAVVTFTPESSPFPGVDTNPVIFMISNRDPDDRFVWAQCRRRGGSDLTDWVLSGLDTLPEGSPAAWRRSLREGLATGLSRPPSSASHTEAVLGDFAFVVRGIATGANEFFHLTRARATSLGIPGEFLVPAIGRTRDVAGEEVTADTLAALDTIGRPTLLFSPDGRPLNGFPESVQEYIKQGEKKGLPRRALLSTRQPWYRMETRAVPPILFAYLGRRNARFLRNKAGVVPLTGFLCVYPRTAATRFLDGLWEVLRAPETLANLALVGKSYGGGAIKVEPRALEHVRLSRSIISRVGLEAPLASRQLSLY